MAAEGSEQTRALPGFPRRRSDLGASQVRPSFRTPGRDDVEQEMRLTIVGPSRSDTILR